MGATEQNEKRNLQCFCPPLNPEEKVKLRTTDLSLTSCDTSHAMTGYKPDIWIHSFIVCYMSKKPFYVNSEGHCTVGH